MSTTLTFSAPTRQERLQYIRKCTAANILEESKLISEESLPRDYLQTLKEDDYILALRACLICWSVTSAPKMIPREMQLRAILADCHGRNSLISAGTGSGKTLPIAIMILLDNPEDMKITITISPLKRLQVTQENDFNSKYGIYTLVVNEDTPRTDAWWSQNIYSSTNPIQHPVQHIIVTVEQLFMTPEGHTPRLGNLLRLKPFQKCIPRVNVDEAHFIYTAGLPLYGLNAFRPAWGRLGDLKALLPSNIRWHLFSATFPEHILKVIKETLLKTNYDYIHITSNRPNIMYATHQVENTIEDVRNYECFLTSPFDIAQQPHVLIFMDDKALTVKVADYLDSCLPLAHRAKGIVRHYHSSMSQMYLEQAHHSFTSGTGSCKILVTTSGQSVGVDFPNVKIVCTAGLPSTIVDALQRGGRAIRTGNEDALFVIFYEPWALEINVEEYKEGKYLHDPDRPRQDLRPSSQRRERAPYSAVCLIHSTTCIREYFAEYLGDQTESAKDYTSPFCCERHQNGFVLQDYLPAKIYKEAGIKRKEAPEKARRYRPVKDRRELDLKVIEWLTKFLEQDKLMRSSYDILADEQRLTLLRIPSKDVESPLSIVRALDETEEWAKEFAEPLFKIIHDHDISIMTTKKATASAKKTTARTSTGDNFILMTVNDFGNTPGPSKPRRNAKKVKT